MQMDVSSEHMPADEPFLFSSVGKGVMNAISAIQTIVSNNARAVETMPANGRSPLPKQTIVRELDIGVPEMN